jgi:hypothetical protein
MDASRVLSVIPSTTQSVRIKHGGECTGDRRMINCEIFERNQPWPIRDTIMKVLKRDTDISVNVTGVPVEFRNKLLLNTCSCCLPKFLMDLSFLPYVYILSLSHCPCLKHLSNE